MQPFNEAAPLNLVHTTSTPPTTTPVKRDLKNDYPWTIAVAVLVVLVLLIGLCVAGDTIVAWTQAQRAWDKRNTKERGEGYILYDLESQSIPQCEITEEAIARHNEEEEKGIVSQGDRPTVWRVFSPR